MIQLIVGKKGKGKTKCLLDRANTEVRDTLGNIVYLDKSTDHMYELNNRIRLISVPDFHISSTDQFIGFVLGIISQDHDLEQMYFDSFLKVAKLEGKDITDTINRIRKISEKFDVNFFISISIDEADVPDDLKELIAVAL